MSGEAAIGLAVVVVGGSVWLAAKGVQVGALVAARSVDKLGAGLIAVGDRAQQRRAEWAAEHSALVAWEDAARQVVELNARIDVVRRFAGADLVGALPAPLSPCGQTPAELAAWCDATRRAVADVERRAGQRAATAVLTVLRGSVDRERSMSADEAFRRYHQAMAADAAQRTATPPAALAAVTRIVGRLSSDTSDADRADVLAAATQVAVPRPDVDHETLLDELRLRVQRAEERTVARRADSMLAATMLQAVPADADDTELPDLRRKLHDVVAARRPLDEGLRAEVVRVNERVRVRLERDYVRASVSDALAGLGYEVDEGFATVTGNPDRMRLRHPEWHDHAVQVVVAGDQVRAAVVRLVDHGGDDARRQDVEREEQWCQDLTKLRTALDGAGVDVEQRHLVPPGERIPPLVKRQEDTRAPRQATVERPR